MDTAASTEHVDSGSAVTRRPVRAVLPTVSILGVLTPEPGPPSFSDLDGDGLPERVLHFDAETLKRLVAADGTFSIGGEIEDRAWFTGTGRLRGSRPGLPLAAID